MTLDDLIAAFKFNPTGAGVPDPDARFATQSGIESQPPTATFYVPPPMELRSGSLTAPVLLLSAPAAVGKTALARELQRRLLNKKRRVLYIPLHKSAIGDNFFSGLLAKLYPGKSSFQIISAIAAGTLVLIFDGYDEVSLANGQLIRNLAFSQEVAAALDVAPDRVSAPSIIFLFRTVFEHHGVFSPLDDISAHVDVQFFDEKTRRLFLRQYLQWRCPDKPGLPSLADAFLGAFEHHLSAAKREAAAFFGHAVVLAAFGDFLADSESANAQTLANDLTRAPVDDSLVSRILGGIIAVILERETKKFPHDEYRVHLPGFEGLPVALQVAFLREIAGARNRSRPSTSLLTSFINQRARSVLSAHADFMVLSSDQRDSLVGHYSEELQRRIEQHPFLDMAEDGQLSYRNPIYEEYYLAQAVIEGRLTMSAALRANPNASHFLALFLMAALPDRDFSRLSPDALVHAFSLLNSAASSSDYRMEIQLKDGYWSASFDGRDLAIAPVRCSRSSDLTIDVPNEAVIQNLDIVGGSDGIVRIQAPPGALPAESGFRLRACSIDCEWLELDAASISMETCSLWYGLLELNNRVAALDGIGTLMLHPREGAELIMSDHVKNRWGEDLRARVVADRAPGPDAVKSLLESVLLWFRKHGRESYAVYDKRFDTVVLRKGRGRRIAEFAHLLFDVGILARSGDLIELQQKQLATYGVFYRKQNALECDESLLAPLVAAWATRDPGPG